MPANDPPQGLMPSLLDRLIDPDADVSRQQQGYSVAQMVAAVHRDLEDLLNTRQTSAGLPADCTLVQRSIVAYGMPDLANIPALSPSQRAQIGRVLEAIILRYEPRLRDVKATLLDPRQEINRTIKFRVEARLNVEPAPEVAFDTILELTTGHSSIARPEK
jgi:type VI secretion system protein ImpF